jgi:ADP-L-glycero-D-manno-heptose 6-epimerase
MRVLVTGGAGFIASNVVKLLEKKGAKVVVVDDFSSADYKNIINLKAEIICGSVVEDALFKKLPRIDAVIHEGAITDTTLKDDSKMLRVNFNGFKNVLNFCLKKKIRLVYASSAGVYGLASAVMTERQKLTPHNIYAYSKCLCDVLAQSLMSRRSSSRIVGLRYFNVYGPGEKHKGKSASMIYQLYLQMKDNQRPRLFKYGEQKRDFIYVKDAAAITVAALESTKSAMLNVGTGRPRSFNDIVSILNRLLHKNLEPAYFDNPYSGIYQNYTHADTKLLKKTLKTDAHFSLEKGISDYLASLPKS